MALAARAWPFKIVVLIISVVWWDILHMCAHLFVCQSCTHSCTHTALSSAFCLVTSAKSYSSDVGIEVVRPVDF